MSDTSRRGAGRASRLARIITRSPGSMRAVNGDTTSKSQTSSAALRRPRHETDIPT
jgi:hypothetical protein